MSHARTDELRRMAKALGLRYTRGYTLPGGRRVNEDTTTTLHPACVTFSEDEDGALWCEDAISPRQALALAMVVDEPLRADSSAAEDENE
jgi:hypothetical protein